ncbi:YczE/YyaS/YitT family protein [Halalkalibacter alkalisediminis]|uniref:YitT family protein n=1 Tax=Halalkalibacter alkalisediminis TaxID=935616 RepID=A0ABV6NA18_9BACI|nr:YitT family protein [Halalkalibacter alkalisediminis]
MGKRIAIYLVGLSLTSFGIALIILSQIGAGPWDAVAVGLNTHLGLTIGLWSIIAQAMVVFITWLVERKRFQYGSVVAIVLRSWFLDIWIYVILKNVDFTSSETLQWFTLFIGVVTVGIGIGLYIEARLPRTPMDGLMIALHERFHWSLNVSRIGIELSGVIFALLLSGPVGLGTVIIAVTLGRVVQFSNSKFKSLIKIDDMPVKKMEELQSKSS